ACGVCHSDWHLVTGATKHPMPVIAGHEGAGVVQAVGQGVTDVNVGDHVVLGWAPACGRCFYCLRDRPNLCDTYTGPIWNGTMLDGTTRHALNGKALYSYCGLAAFATHTVVPRQSCVVIRKDVPLESACLVGCAVATGVGAALFTAKVQPGNTTIQEQALRTIRPGGNLTLAGLSPMGTETNFPAAEIARKEWTIRGSYYGTVNAQRDFPMLLDLYCAGKLNLDDLITRRFK